MPGRVVVAITGGSGMPYALRLLEALRGLGLETHVIISDAARLVLAQEMLQGALALEASAHALYTQRDLAAPPASGSWRHLGMVVCPCSMASLAAIASGLGSNLIHRGADVCLKERRKLVLVPRETPLSDIHLENMLRVSRAGAVVLPACPGFYHRPESIADLVDQVVGRVLDHLDLEHLGLKHDLGPRWGERKER
jgi:flavin prenyltransferase